MKLGTALFLAYLLIFAICFSFPIALIARNLRIRYLEGVEEPLVDQANTLAALVGRQMEAGRFQPDDLFGIFEDVYSRAPSAKIYDLDKVDVDILVYMTDRDGRVIFHSRDRTKIGEDFGDWRDVHLTLQGKYGARTTLDDPEDPTSAVLYVAAPILVNGEISGVLTVAKPTTSINTFLRSSKPEIFRIGVFAALIAVSLSLLVSLSVSRQIQKLTRYANDVREGVRVELPVLAPTELKEMGHAFDKMRESLEGKKYVEKFVQTLTHELKSPVSAIRGATELLGEEMPAERRLQFLSNIRNEAARIQDLVDRMLRLSELETRKSLETIEVIDLGGLIETVVEDKNPLLSLKTLEVQTDIEKSVSVKGDVFLLRQAIANLLQNAIDFSPPAGRIDIRVRSGERRVNIAVEDEGPGIPEYARGRVFERFFSLKRPDTGRKSTGLGLNFVQEVASLHKGEILLDCRAGRGFRASLLLPAWKDGKSSRQS